MLDFNNLANKNNKNVQVFQATGGVLNSIVGNYQLWNKPPGITMVNILMVNSGQGGAGGTTRASLAASNASGGGGGGGGTVQSVTIPAIFTPNQLWVSVAPPALGGAAGSNGSQNNRSFVTYYNFGAGTPSGNGLLMGGGAGTAPLNAGNAGGGSSNGTINTPYIGTLSSEISGGNGTAGATSGATGTDQAWTSATGACTGGTGGGGLTASSNTGYRGGNITMSTSSFNLADIPGGAADGGAGNGGPYWLAPFYSVGGTGGGSNGPGPGGDGGPGIGPGAGGGGGGAGTTGGRGGDSGPGLVIITCW